MENQNFFHTQQAESGITWGNFSAILFVMLLLLGATWIKQPQLFSLNKSKTTQTDLADAPRYYAYEDTVPAEPLVAGANTEDSIGVINEDGSVVPVSMGEVLGASTEGVQLSLDDIKIKTLADSPEEMKKYFASAERIEAGPIENGEFESALSSGDQQRIDRQAQALTDIRDQLQLLPAPKSFEKLHKLKIIQYNAAIGVLQNFTKADDNPELVGNYLQQFLKSQQDLDSENTALAQKFNLSELAIYNAQQ